MSIGYYMLAPPYGEFQALRGDPANVRLEPGALVTLRPRHDTPADNLVGALSHLRSVRPASTFVLWLDLVRRDLAVSFIAAASGTGHARNFVIRAHPDPAHVRAQCATEQGLASAVAAWLETLGFRLEAVARAFISAALQMPFREIGTVQHVTAHLGVKVPRVRESLRRSGFPSSRDLLEILRLLRVALYLQRTQASLDTVSELHDYFDGAAVRRRLNDVFGWPPSEIRSRLGWEWLLLTGLHRHSVSPPHPR